MERNKDDMAVVTGNIFSNIAVQKKNSLVIMLIVSALGSLYLIWSFIA